MCLQPTVGVLLVFESRDHVGAIAFMHGNTVALGDEADDTVSGQGVTALGKLDLTARGTVHHNAPLGGRLCGRRGLDLLGTCDNGCGRLGLYDALKLVVQLLRDLRDGQTAVAHGVIEVIGRIEADSGANVCDDLGSLLFCIGCGKFLEFKLDELAAENDIVGSLFLFEPLADLISRLAGLDDLQPISGGALGARRG